MKVICAPDRAKGHFISIDRSTSSLQFASRSSHNCRRKIFWVQVYVSAAKRKVMEALNLPQEYKALLTTDDKAALLHAVPLWRVSLKHMARVLKHYRGRYNTIVGFQPTGWSMQKGRLLQHLCLLELAGFAECCTIPSHMLLSN